MVCELVDERTKGTPQAVLGDFGAAADVCPADCCRYVGRTR
jgi:hypothetical protein